MTNNSLSDGGTPAVDSEALGQWVAETASQKDISERELLDEILSSYWVLEELSDVIVDSESDEPITGGHSPEQRDAASEPAREEPPVREEPARERATPRHEPRAEPAPRTTERPPNSRTEPSQHDRSDQPAGSGTDDPDENVEISRTFHYRAGDDETDQPDEELELSGIEQELEKLRTVIDELSDTESLPTPESTDGGERADPAAARSGETPEGSEAEDAPQPAAESWSEHSGAIAELDDELVEIRNQLAELETDLTERIETTAEGQDELEAWIEDEFDNIEDVLQHLLSTTDNLEYRIGSAVDSQREQIEPLQQAHTQREQLTTIKDEAIRKGVTTAECEACEETIDLGVLPSPNCPNCEQRFTGVEGAAKWNPFSTATLRTTPQHRRDSPPTAAADSGPAEVHERRSTGSEHSSEKPDFQQSQPPGDSEQNHRTDGESNWG